MNDTLCPNRTSGIQYPQRKLKVADRNATEVVMKVPNTGATTLTFCTVRGVFNRLDFFLNCGILFYIVCY